MKASCTGLRAVLTCVLLAAPVYAQGGREDPVWVRQSPAIGDPFPNLTVFTPDGEEFSTSSLRDHYTVVAFGCLT